jgi:DNA-binding transcriptional ArsR family regulator
MSDVPTRGTLDYKPAEFVSVDTPARLKAASHPLRRLVLDLVMERAMTVSDLAEITGKPRGTVAHHVTVLVNAGLLQIVRTRKVRAIEERFYGRTGRTLTLHWPTLPDDNDLPFFADARSEYDQAASHLDEVCGFTLRHARISPEHACAFTERLMALTLEFTQLPHSGKREFAVLAGVFPTNRLPGDPVPKVSRKRSGARRD